MKARTGEKEAKGGEGGRQGKGREAKGRRQGTGRKGKGRGRERREGRDRK